MIEGFRCWLKGHHWMPWSAAVKHVTTQFVMDFYGTPIPVKDGREVRWKQYRTCDVCGKQQSRIAEEV